MEISFKSVFATVHRSHHLSSRHHQHRSPHHHHRVTLRQQRQQERGLRLDTSRTLGVCFFSHFIIYTKCLNLATCTRTATTTHHVTLRRHDDVSPTAGHHDAALGRKAEGSGRRRGGGSRRDVTRLEPRYVLFLLFLHILIKIK